MIQIWSNCVSTIQYFQLNTHSVGHTMRGSVAQFKSIQVLRPAMDITSNIRQDTHLVDVMG